MLGLIGDILDIGDHRRDSRRIGAANAAATARELERRKVAALEKIAAALTPAASVEHKGTVR